jgi:hypothetical protein
VEDSTAHPRLCQVATTDQAHSPGLRAEPQPIYNARVEGDHCWRVGPQGLLVHNPPVNPSIKEDPAQSSATSYRGEDCLDPRFFIEGSVRSGGILSFLVVAELRDGTRSPSGIRGQDFFDAMLDHFIAQGTTVSIIEAEWQASNPDWRTNLDAFNKALQAGDDEKVAATKTPTGVYATRRGYVNVDPQRLNPPGQKGTYTDVLIHFRT